jgi:L-amino acid dehydrogenase
MGKTHHLFKDLAKEPDIKTFDSFYDGETVFIWNGKRITAPMDSDWVSSFLYVPFDRVPVAEEDRKAARQLRQEFLELTKSVDNERPWRSPQARELDTQTIETWLNSRTNSELTHYIFKWYTRVSGSGGFEPGESSMLHLAQTQKACPQGETPEQCLLYGAAGQVPELLADRIKGLIRTNAAAQAITSREDGCLVKAADGTSHGCRGVVVAVPPPFRSRISFEPSLPHQISGLIQLSPMGSMFKIMTVYKSAWWQQRGLNGLGQGNLQTVELTADSSPPSGNPRVLASFVAADKTVKLGLLSAKQRREAILANLVQYWGPEAGTPDDYIEINWADAAWTTEAFTTYMTTGAWTSFGPAWREPVGRIVWAGTESSSRWAGFYEGAIQAGLDSATSIASLLS